MLSFDHIALQTVVSDVIEQTPSLAITKHLQIEIQSPTPPCWSGPIRIDSAKF